MIQDLSSRLSSIAHQLKAKFPDDFIVGEKSGKRKFSAQLREQFFQEVTSHQVPEGRLADELNISRSTIYKWKKIAIPATERSFKSDAFKKFDIREEEDQSRNVYLEARSGVRVQGLSLSQVVEVLRCL